VWYNNVMPTSAIIPVDAIAKRTTFIRGQRVILDSDLAQLYGVSTSAFNRAVKRNIERFDEDFMFQLSREEFEVLRCQSGTSKSGSGGRRYLPYVFTEHGAHMAGNVLNSAHAVDVSKFIVRAFIQMRDLLATHKNIARQLTELQKRVAGHDKDIAQIVAAIHRLLSCGT
jgi:hypothetical protein